MRIDIKKLRKIEGIAPEDISAILNISQSYTSMILNGKRPMSKDKWDLLKSKICNITDYVIEDCDISKEESENDITESCDMKEITDDAMVPLAVVLNQQQERAKHDAIIAEMLAQQKALLDAHTDLISKIPSLEDIKKSPARKGDSAVCADAV